MAPAIAAILKMIGPQLVGGLMNKKQGQQQGQAPQQPGLQPQPGAPGAPRPQPPSREEVALGEVDNALGSFDSYLDRGKNLGVPQRAEREEDEYRDIDSLFGGIGR